MRRLRRSRHEPGDVLAGGIRWRYGRHALRPKRLGDAIALYDGGLVPAEFLRSHHHRIFGELPCRGRELVVVGIDWRIS